MEDSDLIYAVMLALTQQNVIGSGGVDAYILEDFTGVVTSGWVEQIPAIYGELWQ